MIVGVEIKNGSCDPNHALFKVFVICKLKLDIIYLYTKFDDSSISHSRDINEGPKI